MTLVDDSYNSSPTALRAAFEAVGPETTTRRCVAIVGEMLELGPRSGTMHEDCGRAAVEAGFSVVIAVGGAPAAALAKGARAAGLPDAAVTVFPTSGQAADYAVTAVRDGDVVLVKGSRGIRMDRIVDRLKAER